MLFFKGFEILITVEDRDSFQHLLNTAIYLQKKADEHNVLFEGFFIKVE
jgi:hypothetical protein